MSFWNNILTVSEVTEFKIKAKNNSFGSVCENYLEFSGIKITEEWLSKFDWNGYVPLHFNSNFEIDKQGRLYCNGDYKGVNINYVHQLQNIYFALTGRELTER